MTVTWESILGDIDRAKRRLKRDATRSRRAMDAFMASATGVASTPHKCVQRALDEPDVPPDEAA